MEIIALKYVLIDCQCDWVRYNQPQTFLLFLSLLVLDELSPTGKGAMEKEFHLENKYLLFNTETWFKYT